MKTMASSIVCLLMLLVVSLSSSCASNQHTPPNVNAPSIGKTPISVKELCNNRAQLSGHTVSVYGFYYSNSPTSALFPDQASFDKKDSSNCLWIGQDKPASRAASTPRKNGVWVIIEGTLKNESAGPFDQFFAQLEEVTSFQVLPGPFGSQADGDRPRKDP